MIDLLFADASTIGRFAGELSVPACLDNPEIGTCAVETRRLYEEYPHNDTYIASYIEYQKRYLDEIRKLLELVAGVLPERTARPRPRLLDICCSTGNLLCHLRAAFGQFELTGGDLSRREIEAARANPRLSGIDFEVMDIRQLGPDPHAVVVAGRRAPAGGRLDRHRVQPLRDPDGPHAGRREELRSYTVPAADRRLIFRGVLNQPWCHLVARREAAPTP